MRVTLRRWSGSLRMAAAQVRPQLGQLSVAIVVIALGVALAAGMLLANTTLRDSFEESVQALAGRADLQVTALSGSAFDAALLPSLKSVPGVDAAAPLLLGKAFLEDDDQTAVRIVGVDMLDDATVRLYEKSPTQAAGIDDPLVFLNQTDSALVSEVFLRRHASDHDRGFWLSTPSGRRRLVARGVLADRGVARAFGGEMAILDLFAAQDLLAAPDGISQIDILLAPDADPQEVGARLRRILPPHLVLETVAARSAAVGELVAGFQIMLNAMAAMGLGLAALITANRLSTIYQERTWELGVLRAQGMSPGALQRSLLLEATVVSLLAVAFGLPLGVLFAQVIVQPVADSISLNLQQVVGAPWVSPTSGALTLASLAGLAAGIAAATLPARAAVRAGVRAVLAQARRRDPWPPNPRRRLLRLVACLSTAALLAFEILVGPTVLAPLAMALLLLAAILLIEPGLRLVTQPVSALFGSAARIGVEDQSRLPSRAAGAAAVLMVGVAVVVWIAAMARSFEDYVVATNMGLGRGHILVVSASGNAGSGADEPDLPISLRRELEMIPGVAVVGTTTLRIALEPKTGIIALDPVRFRDRRFGHWPLVAEDPKFALEQTARGEAFLAGEAFLRHRNVQVGDVVEVTTPSGPLRRPVLGVADTIILSPQGDLILSQDLFREHWKDTSAQRFAIVVDDDDQAPAIANEIRRQLGPRFGILALSMEGFAGHVAENVRRATAFLDVIVVLTLLVVLVGTADALSSNVLERTREIGTLRALGLAPRHIAVMILAQAAAVGIVGASLAIFLGFALGFEFVGGLVPLLLGWQLDFKPTWAVAFLSAALGLLACLGGALVPALRAARRPVVQALRYE